jgi:hypothetical protein
LFSGGHHDLLTITLHKLVVNGAYKLVPLYSCFLTIICNVSPYWRSMSLVAAVKLVNLFELFSSPKFLYSGEHAHRHLALLLEVFNNVIQYQYHGNTHLVYALIRRKVRHNIKHMPRNAIELLVFIIHTHSHSIPCCPTFLGFFRTIGCPYAQEGPGTVP